MIGEASGDAIKGEVLEFRPMAGAGGADPNFIRVDFSRYLETRDVEPMGLFKGFDSIKIVTFSMGVSFLEKLLPYFETCAVVVGCDAIMQDSLKRVMAHQSHVFKDVRSKKYLVDRIESGTLQIWATRGVVAHTKLYLMSARDGRVRTVLGSANASSRAWNGSQFESYVCYDEKVAYDAWNDRFESLVRDVTSPIVLEGAAEGPGEGLENPSGNASDDAPLQDFEALPIVQEVKRSGHGLVLELDGCRSEERRYELELKQAENRFDMLLPRRQVKKGSTTVLDFASLERVRAERRKLVERRQVQEGSPLPKFVIDCDAHTATLDGEPLDLCPSDEEVRRDADLLVRFMESLDAFQGDTDVLKTSYYKALTHVFASPFVSRLRLEACKEGLDGYDWNYPAYLLITGERSAGKSMFVTMLHRLMFGRKRICVRKELFTPGKLREVQDQVSGVPILIDEMNPGYFKYAKSIVKDDSFLVEEGRSDLPTFIILSNELRKGVDPSVAKRVMHVDVDNKMTPNDMKDKNAEVTLVVREMGTALYRRYLAEMFDEVDGMLDQLRDGSAEQPDLYRASSRVLIKALKSCGADIPPQMHEFTWKECMGDTAGAGKAIAIIKKMVVRDSRRVDVNRRLDEVVLDLSGYPPGLREEMMANLVNGVPLAVERTSETLVIHGVKRLESLVGLRFGRRWLRLFG